MTTKQSKQSRERLQVEWLLFSLNENTPSLPVEFSKIVKDMKGKSEQSLFVSVEINCTI